MVFKEHGVMLYLDKTLYRAFIRLQADRELGRSYAGLLPFVEGLYTMGYLDKEDYVEHRQRYSEKLVDVQVVTVPKCSLCEKNSVAMFEDVNGVQKVACDYHSTSLREHPKWKEITPPVGRKAPRFRSP